MVPKDLLDLAVARIYRRDIFRLARQGKGRQRRGNANGLAWRRHRAHLGAIDGALGDAGGTCIGTMGSRVRGRPREIVGGQCRDIFCKPQRWTSTVSKATIMMLYDLSQFVLPIRDRE